MSPVNSIKVRAFHSFTWMIWIPQVWSHSHDQTTHQIMWSGFFSRQEWFKSIPTAYCCSSNCRVSAHMWLPIFRFTKIWGVSRIVMSKLLSESPSFAYMYSIKVSTHSALSYHTYWRSENACVHVLYEECRSAIKIFPNWLSIKRIMIDGTYLCFECIIWKRLSAKVRVVF